MNPIVPSIIDPAVASGASSMVRTILGQPLGTTIFPYGAAETQRQVNPAWENAPYRVDFLLGAQGQYGYNPTPERQAIQGAIQQQNEAVRRALGSAYTATQVNAANLAMADVRAQRQAAVQQTMEANSPLSFSHLRTVADSLRESLQPRHRRPPTPDTADAAAMLMSDTSRISGRIARSLAINSPWIDLINPSGRANEIPLTPTEIVARERKEYLSKLMATYRKKVDSYRRNSLNRTVLTRHHYPATPYSMGYESVNLEGDDKKVMYNFDPRHIHYEWWAKGRRDALNEKMKRSFHG